jgi:hypothetical protein
MKENIELARNREFGDIISDTFALFRQNFKPLLKAYFAICGLFILTNIIISAVINDSHQDSSLNSLSGLVELLFTFINYTALILTTQAYYVLYKEKANQPPDLLEVWGYFRYYFFRVIGSQFLLAILVIVGGFLCFLPGIYLAVVFSLVTPIMVSENGNLQYSFNKAFKIIKGNWWFTFGVILLISIIVIMLFLVFFVLPFIFYGSANWLSGKDLSMFAGILQSVVVNLGQVLWILPYTALMLVYYALTEEKEGNSLMDRISSFGKNSRGADQISSEQY